MDLVVVAELLVEIMIFQNRESFQGKPAYPAVLGGEFTLHIDYSECKITSRQHELDFVSPDHVPIFLPVTTVMSLTVLMTSGDIIVVAG